MACAKTIREVRAFLGLAGYYRRFVPHFASIAAPLNSMMGKGKSFVWKEETQHSFDQLKLALTSPPILAMPSDTGEFILDVDAAYGSIGAVLSQIQDGSERVIAYASRKLDRREMNYCVTRKELLAVVYFLRYFRQHLLGRKFRIRSDHSALMWLKHTPDPIGQQARWLKIMEEFDFSIEHRKGSRHANADALSRRPCPVCDCACRQPPNSDMACDEGCTGQNEEEGYRDADLEVRVARQLARGHDVEDGADQSARLDASIGGAADRRDDNLQDLEERIEDKVEDQGVTVHSPWSLAGLAVKQQEDRDISCIIKLLQSSEVKPSWENVALSSHDVKTLWAQWPRLAIKDGLLKRRFEAADGKSVQWQVVVPASLRVEFMQLAHGGMTGGHFGRRRTLAAVQSRAYWPCWRSDVEKFLRQCNPCARYHRGTVPRRAGLQPTLVGEPWERVSIDITGPHPRSSRQNQYILMCVDHFSKWAEAIPLANHTATSVARALMTHIFSRFGALLQLLSDRGSEFESQLFSQLMKWMEIDKLRTTAYQPSTNGAVERVHRTLNTMLGKVVSDTQRDWDEKLPAVMAAYRASVHEATGYSPNRLFLGREVRMPLDLVMGLPPDSDRQVSSMDGFVQQTQEQMTSTYDIV